MAVIRKCWGIPSRFPTSRLPTKGAILRWGRQFEDTFENTQRRKIKQMHSVWLCLLWPKFFEETREEAQISVERRKVTICHREQTLWCIKAKQIFRVKIRNNEINIKISYMDGSFFQEWHVYISEWMILHIEMEMVQIRAVFSSSIWQSCLILDHC